MLPSPVNFFLAKFARPRWASVTTSAAGCPRRRPSPLEQWRRNSVFFLRSFYWRGLFFWRPFFCFFFRENAGAERPCFGFRGENGRRAWWGRVEISGGAAFFKKKK